MEARTNRFGWMKETASERECCGIEYLCRVQRLVSKPELVDVQANVRDRREIWEWIGAHIEQVNARLRLDLQACQDCFHIHEQRSAEIYAVPIAQTLRVDGLCNLETRPCTILVDVGRVEPINWIALVAHEYAHAHIGSSGHNAEYGQVLSHLCLGLELAVPAWEAGEENTLQHWPPYSSVLDPLAFWRGNDLFI